MRKHEDVAHLGSCTSLTSLDLGGCQLEDVSIMEELVVSGSSLCLCVIGATLLIEGVRGLEQEGKRAGEGRFATESRFS